MMAPRFALLLLLTVSLTACTSVPPPSRTIDVTGEAVIKIVPDEMDWCLEVTTLDYTLAETKARHDSTLTHLQQFLQGLGAKISDLQTGGFQFSRNEYAEKGAPRYSCSTQVSFTLKDFDQYGPICDELAALTNINIQCSSYTSSKVIETREKSRTQALRDAQAKAQAMAETLGVHLGPPRHISEQGNDQPQAGLARYANSVTTMASASTTPEPVAGNLEIRSYVQVTFDLVP